MTTTARARLRTTERLGATRERILWELRQSVAGSSAGHAEQRSS